MYATIIGLVGSFKNTFARADEEGAYPLRFFDSATGKVRLLTRVQGQSAFDLTVSPESQTVLFSVAKPIN